MNHHRILPGPDKRVQLMATCLCDAFYADAVRHARFLRNRYTFLDLAADAGVLDGHLRH